MYMPVNTAVRAVVRSPGKVALLASSYYLEVILRLELGSPGLGSTESSQGNVHCGIACIRNEKNPAELASKNLVYN